MTDPLMDEAISNIKNNHAQILDDWCKAYMAQLHGEGVDIKPGCFKIIEQELHEDNGKLVKKYWMERMNEWKSIESAPTDGTSFIVYRIGIPQICHHDGIGWYCSGMGCCSHENDIDCWLPIPKPPKKINPLREMIQNIKDHEKNSRERGEAFCMKICADEITEILVMIIDKLEELDD